MELFASPIGAITLAVFSLIILIALAFLINRLLEPQKNPNRAKEPYSLVSPIDDLSYYNQANHHFKRLDSLKDNPQEFEDTLLEVIRLCQLDINHSPRTTDSGDAMVMLANSYFLLSIIFDQPATHEYLIILSFAVIDKWKKTPIYTKNRANGEKIHTGIIQYIEHTKGVMAPLTLQAIAAISNGTNTGLYDTAIHLDLTKGMHSVRSATI